MASEVWLELVFLNYIAILKLKWTVILHFSFSTQVLALNKKKVPLFCCWWWHSQLYSDVDSNIYCFCLELHTSKHSILIDCYQIMNSYGNPFFSERVTNVTLTYFQKVKLQNKQYFRVISCWLWMHHIWNFRISLVL
jgi:hypothetical protein